jgi:hypothetical protein
VYKQAWSIKNYRYIGDVSERPLATAEDASVGRAEQWPPSPPSSPTSASSCRHLLPALNASSRGGIEPSRAGSWLGSDRLGKIRAEPRLGSVMENCYTEACGSARESSGSLKGTKTGHTTRGEQVDPIPEFFPQSPSLISLVRWHRPPPTGVGTSSPHPFIASLPYHLLLPPSPLPPTHR